MIATVHENNYVITVGRQFGSGGRELGQLLAKKLGIAYYDKELLSDAAHQAGVAPEIFERCDEKFPTFLNGVLSFTMGFNPVNYYSGSTSISDDSVYRAQSDFIRSVAMQHPCVIVGRSADYVLRDHPCCIKIFVHAPVEECIKRIMRRGDRTTPEQARTMAEKTNKLRASYYNFYTDKHWGRADSYDLTVDSSLMPMEELAELVAEYVRHRIRQS